MRHAVERLSRLSSTQVLLFDFVAVATFAFVMSLQQQQPPLTAGNIGESQANEKRIAYSFDDSPRGVGNFLDVGQCPQMQIAELARAGIAQAAFFANPGRISPSNKGVAIIATYAAAGHLVANHMQNQVVLSSVSAEAFLADVDLAETWLKPRRN